MNILFSSLLSDFPSFISLTSGLSLRPYQLSPVTSLLNSIHNHLGHSIVIVFPRQSGKDEFILHLLYYLLNFYSEFPVGIVVVNPTYKPQTLNALLRFDQLLSRNPLTAGRWRKHGDFMRLLDLARVSFLSGNASSNVVGATASLLLVINEAQDISPSHYQRKFLPMAASTNATRLFAGTLWTSSTLLSQEVRHARYAQEQDGHPRLFMFDADHVRQVVPNYGLHVDSVIARWGRQHPLVKTQYFNEEIDASSSMFNPARLSLLFPSINPCHCEEPQSGDEAIPKLSVNSLFVPVGAAQASPSQPRARKQSSATVAHPGAQGPDAFSGRAPGQPISFLLDLAGQDESIMSNPLSNETCAQAASSRHAPPWRHESPGTDSRDSASLSIVAIDLSSVPELNYPSYRVVHRLAWTGESHLTIFAQLKTLADTWKPRYFVIDATGVGEGLWALLDKAFPDQVIPVKFTASLKSEIGYRFLAMINTGRFRGEGAVLGDPRPPRCTGSGGSAESPSDYSSPISVFRNGGGGRSPEGVWFPSQSQVEAQYRAVQSEVLPGPAHTLRWGVPEGTRDADGALLHDDFVLADSLVTQLDNLDWSLTSPSIIFEPSNQPPRYDHFHNDFHSDLLSSANDHF